MELLDIYDASLNYLGTENRDIVHKEGLWHKTFHCWLYSEINNGSLLVQMRSKSKKTSPGKMDITAAGHLLAGETVQDGIREVVEELGIDVELKDTNELGYRVEVSDNGGKKNREYQSVHMLKCNCELVSFRPQVEEVAGLYRITLEDAFQLFRGQVEEVPAVGIELTEENKYIEIHRNIKRDDFIKRVQNYYLTICIMAERLLAGKNIVGIS